MGTVARRGGIAAALLSRLAGCGYPVAVADRGTRPNFTNGLQEIPGVRVVVTTAVGLAGQMKASVSVASTFRTRYLLYVEPDKEDFFANRLRDFVECAPDEHDVGIVLASRSTDSLATFPPMQQYTEAVVNHLCGKVLGTIGDYTYGPFLMHRNLLPHMAVVDAELGWGLAALSVRGGEAPGAPAGSRGRRPSMSCGPAGRE